MTELFDILLVSFAVIYFALMLYLRKGLSKTSIPTNGKQHKLSVVIAAFNEQENLGKCLDALLAQDYPRNLFEIIVADDRSTDKTPEIIEDYCRRSDNIRSVRVDVEEDVVPKKGALLKALPTASGDIIVSTDADCIHPKRWLSSINSYFTDDVGMVVGNAVYPKSENILKGVDALDYFSQRAMGAAFIGVGSVYTSTAANLAYRRGIFEELKDDFARLKVRPAEDNFLINYIQKSTDYKIVVASDKDSIVKTKGASDVRHFLNQRFRWGAYGDGILNVGVLAFFIPALLFYLLIWLGVLFSIFDISVLPSLIIAVVVKLVADLLFLKRATNIFHCSYLLKYFPLAWIVNLVLVPLIIVKSNFSSFQWKGKRFTAVGEVKA